MPAVWRRWLAVMALAFAGCLSPTLPLPPPEEPDSIQQGTDGVWELRGDCLAGAEVIAVNERTGRGAVFVDLQQTGRYVVVIQGEACDVAVLSQFSGDEGSGEIRTVLREVEGSIDQDPGVCTE
jgi:hypothetical protein